MEEPSRSCHGEGNITGVGSETRTGFHRGKESSTHTKKNTEQERPVFAAVVAARHHV